MKYLISFFISSSFFESFRILPLFFLNKKTDILIYYPQHFNTDSSSPFLIQQILNSLRAKNISFLLVEEPNLMHKTRNKSAIPADIFWVFVIVMRKFFNGNDYHSIDLKIGRFLSKFIPKHSFSKIITVSQSFQSIFRGMFPTADLFDYQHGLISDKYIGYVEGNGVSKHLISNKCKVLLYGEGFKHKLMKFKDGCYFEKYSAVVGSPYSLYINSFDSFNYSILFTLQFTSSHDQKVNQFFLEKTLDFFRTLDHSDNEFIIYLKEHPRFENCIDDSDLYKFKFIRKAPENLNDCFKLCSLHITEYSSVVFDALAHGIPTLLTSFSNDLNILIDEYNFPQSSNHSLQESICKMKTPSYFNAVCKEQIEWSKKLYTPFMAEKFLSVLTKNNLE